MMVFGPETTSPPAKIPARPVARVRGSATMPAQPLTSIPAPSGRIDGSGSSPTATRIVVAWSSSSEPGIGSHAPTAIAGRRRGRSRPDAADADYRTVAAHDLHRREPGPDDDPLALGCLDLLDLGRHLVAAPSIDDRNRRRAAPPGGARRVHRRAPSADDHGRAGEAWLLAEVDPLEEEGRRDDARGIVTGDAEAATLRGARRQEDRAVSLPSRSPRVKSRPIAVSSRRSTPSPTIRAISAWSTSRGSRYDGMPIAIIPPGTGIASKTVTG